jgi:regulator of cell morphogenesis and NO signaling
MNFERTSASEIAVNLPGATAVFFAHKINFCAQNHEALGVAMQNRPADAERIYAELQSIIDRQEHIQEFDTWPKQQIIEYIVTRFHDVHRQQLPELIRLAERVETTHVDSKYCPVGLSQYLVQIQNGLEEHMQKEENVLFPMLAQEHLSLPAGPIQVMKREHDDHLSHISDIFEITNDIQLHPDACNSWKALYLGLQAFINDIYMHIFIENNVLFVR